MQLFASLMPTNTISRAEQLSAVIRGSLVDDSHYHNLVLLARNHPGVALCLGFADAEVVAPGKTTFEIRNFDIPKNQDVAVVGRVTVDTADPTTLPAPGPPVLMPDTTARGDINLKFRWGTPDNLRRLGLLQFGYNLWRVPKDYAMSNGWNSSPPLTSDLVNRWKANSNIVKRVNRLPIVTPKLFSLADAPIVTPPGDTNTMFIADDDGRFKPGYVNYNFTNGAQFYYFATARDILARDGAVSLGLLATVCDRMPPPVPMNVKVVNDYKFTPDTAVSLQALRVNWNQVTNYPVTYFTNGSGVVTTNYSDMVTNYWIYRWTNVGQMQALSGDISNHLIAVVPHLAGLKTGTFLDAGPSAPGTNDYGKTWWYTVRAGDAGACGQNLSANSGPAYGVLRDRVGPEASPAVFVTINCPQPWVDFVQAYSKAIEKNDASSYVFNVTCTQQSRQIAWAEFYVWQSVLDNKGDLTFSSNYLGRVLYSGRDTKVDAWWSYPRTTQQATNIFFCRAGTFSGKVADYAMSSPIPSQGLPLPDPNSIMEVDFTARLIATPVVLGQQQGQSPCQSHDPDDPATGVRVPLSICIQPTATSREWRLYQRVDAGPLTLYAQGTVTNSSTMFCVTNDTVPASPGTRCFYVQLLDENGNASPLRRYSCLEMGTMDMMPTPVLSTISPAGDSSALRMNLSWFCPLAGLDRFQVWIGRLTTNVNPYMSSSLGFSNAPPQVQTVTVKGVTNTYNFYQFASPRISTGFGSNSPTFQLTASVEMGPYAVYVKAVGKHGGVGDQSNVETFEWSPTNAIGPMVPWPARPLPETSGSFQPLAAFLAPTNVFWLRTEPPCAAVLVGSNMVAGRLSGQGSNVWITAPYDPNKAIFSNIISGSLFPVAMYRYQVTNENFAEVSGDITQVSPLMENIAYELRNMAGGITNTYVQDPFIVVTASNAGGASPLYFWLLDTQPQISGARYRYLLVRFKSNREIDQIIPSNEVDVP